MKILEAELLASAPRIDKLPSSGLPEIAFLGRSNVGKSSLLNALARRKKLARTSSTPGKTRELVLFRVRTDQPSGSLVTIKRAVASMSPAGPRKKRIVLVGSAASIAVAILVSILRRQWRRAHGSSRFRDRLRMVRRHLRIKNRAQRSAV